MSPRPATLPEAGPDPQARAASKEPEGAPALVVQAVRGKVELAVAMDSAVGKDHIVFQKKRG